MPSVSAAIAYNGSLMWAGAVGYADLESETQATVNSRYRLGSVSKSITGTLLSILVDKDIVDLDTKASDYMPALPAQLSQLTPRMLASHTGGIRHYSGFPGYWPTWHPQFSNKSYASVAAGLGIFLKDDLLFPPGTNFNYSTYGFSLLSRLMEQASGMSFDKLLHNEIFTKAGMTNTQIDHPGSMHNRVSFYTTAKGNYIETYPTNSSYKIAGGGIVSTPTDLVALGQLLLNDELITVGAKLIMWTPATLPGGVNNPQNYGLGWRIDESSRLSSEGKAVTIIHHGGSQNGGVAFFMLIPSYGISVAAVSNTGAGNARRSVQAISNELVRLAVAEMDSD